MPTLNTAQTATVNITTPGAFLTVDCSSGAVVRVSWTGPGSASGIRTVRNISEDLGPFVDNTVITMVCESGTATYTEVGSQIQYMVSGALKSTALVKLPTSSASFGLATGTASTSNIAATISTKIPLPAPFVGVQLVSDHRTNNAMTGQKCLVGVSETMAQTNSATLSQPTLGGTSYAALAGATDVNGFRSVTWAGSATVDHAASVTAPDLKLSDWVPLTSVPRADGGSGYPIMWRTYRLGGANGYWNFTPLTATPAPTAANRYTEVVNCIAYNDAIATIGNSMALNNTGQDVAVHVRFDRPVVSVWGVGDSTIACHGLVTDKVSSWLWRACADLSTAALPWVYANFGVPGAKSDDFLTNAEAYLASGVTPPFALVVSVTINDITSSPNVRTLEAVRASVVRAVEIAKKYSIRNVAFASAMPYEGMSQAQDNLRKQANAEAQATATRYGCGWISFAGVGDGGSPELFIPAYKFDNFHPNETAIEAVMTVAAKAWLSTRV